jgi:hypothetical protein
VEKEASHQTAQPRKEMGIRASNCVTADSQGFEAGSSMIEFRNVVEESGGGSWSKFASNITAQLVFGGDCEHVPGTRPGLAEERMVERRCSSLVVMLVLNV